MFYFHYIAPFGIDRPIITIFSKESCASIRARASIRMNTVLVINKSYGSGLSYVPSVWQAVTGLLVKKTELKRK